MKDIKISHTASSGIQKSTELDVVAIKDIFIAKHSANELDFYRFFEVTEVLQDNKITIKELHQCKESDSLYEYCTPLVGIYISDEVYTEYKNNSLMINGNKFADKLKFEQLDIGVSAKIKIYPTLKYPILN